MKKDESIWNDTIKASDIVREQKWGALGVAYNSIKNLFSTSAAAPLTVARNISTSGNVAGTDSFKHKEVTSTSHAVKSEQLGSLPEHHQKVWNAKGEIEKLSNGVPLTQREKAQAYERHVEKFAHDPRGLYDGAVSNTGALSHTSIGKTESISRVGEANRIFKTINKENAIKM